jgi:hypothetical protein
VREGGRKKGESSNRKEERGRRRGRAWKEETGTYLCEAAEIIR